MRKFWLRHRTRDLVYGPAPLDELLRNLPDGESPDSWQVQEARGQAYHTLKGDFGWQLLTDVMSAGEIRNLRTGAGGTDPGFTVPAPLEHMREPVLKLAEGLDSETRHGPEAGRWAWLLLHATRSHTAYRGLRGAINWLAVLLWIIGGVPWLIQGVMMLGWMGDPSVGPDLLIVPLMFAGGLAAYVLLIHVLKHLALALLDMADLQLERQRQSGLLPGQPIDR